MHWIPCSLIKSLRKRVSVVCVSYSFTTLKKLMNSLTNHCLLELLSLNTLFPLICSTSDKSGLLRWIKHVSFAESLVSTPPPCAGLHIWQHALLREHFYEQLHLICMGGEKYWEKKKKSRGTPDYPISLGLHWHRVWDVSRKKASLLSPGNKACQRR